MRLPHKNFVFGVLIGSALITVLGCTFLLNSSRGLNATLTNDEETDYLSAADKLFRAYDGVETFILFIGYPRSGHSLIGALLDAHPEIIIPHEYGIVDRWNEIWPAHISNKRLGKHVIFYRLHQLSQEQSLFGNRANNCLYGSCGYNYNVPGQWQGSYNRRIKVIGDKKGGRTAEHLANWNNSIILEEIRETVQVPIKFIHVTRNPFDNIATMTLRLTGSREAVRRNNETKINKAKYLERSILRYFTMATGNQHVREKYGDAVLDIQGHEAVLRPKQAMQTLCNHLRVTCSEEYLDKCEKILYGTPSVTRNTVVWTEEQKARVTEMMRKFPFLKDYSFDKYPE